MKTAVIYARYSSERQTEQSIEGQLRVCNDYAARNGIVIIDTYIDRAMTGTNDKRTDFQRMLKDSAKKAWNYVIVYKIDRFGRNKYELAMNKHTLKNNGIRLLSAMENIPDTPEGIILESLLEGMAEYYSAELSQKVRRGMNESRQKGNYTGGMLLYGYKKEGKKVVVDEDKAKVVRYIFESYAKDIYVKDIIKHLTENGILNKGKPFAQNTIYYMLQSEKYIGIYRYKDQEFTNMYPPIVPLELFKIVQKKNAKNQYGSHSPYVNYLLHKKLVCGYCGRQLNGITGTSKSKKVKRYYSCRGKYLKKTCIKKNIRKEELEDIVFETITNIFSNEKIFTFLSDKIIEINKEKLKNNTIINILSEQLSEKVKSKNNILEAIENGIITTTTKERLLELEKQINDMEEKIAVEKAKTKMMLSKSDIKTYLKKSLQNSKERIFDLLIDKVVVYDNKIEIYCNYTNKKNNETLDFNIYKNKTNFIEFSQESFQNETKEMEVKVNV